MIGFSGILSFINSKLNFKCYIHFLMLFFIIVTFQILFQFCAFATTIVTGTTVGVKFHPGHYLQPLGGDKSVNGFAIKETYADINSSPALVGIQLNLDWIDLEPSKDVINYKLIQDHLDKMKGTGAGTKRLIIYIVTKTTELDAPFIPSYLKTEPVYQGGLYPWGNSVGGSIPTVHKGNGIKFWIPEMRDRMVLLMQKLGARFNAHSNFEGIGLPETAIGQPLITVTAAQEEAVHKNYLFVQKKMKIFFPNTMTFQFTNYPKEILPWFIMGATDSLKSMGVGLGGPDVWLNDPGVNYPGSKYNLPGVYTYYPKLSGIVPLTPSVQSGDYKCSRADCNNSKGNFVPTVRQLLDFARDKLKANYLFWTRVTPTKYKEVINMIKNLDTKNDPAVKLIKTCPSMLAPCITD